MIINDNERVQLLTKISVDISIKTGEITFSLPDFGLTNKETMIDNSTWDQYRGELVSGQEVWGVVELGYRPPDDTPQHGSTAKSTRGMCMRTRARNVRRS